MAEICRRLEGLPLAIELAAARTRLLDPPALLDRLAASLDALGTGAVDLPERQRTLRATVEWSVGLLEDAERSLLEVAAVFTDGWTIPAVAQVAGLDEDRALELCEALARHSLVAVDSTELGPRSRMLETVREFVAERLAARPDTAEVGRRHAGRELRRPRQAAVPPSRPELHDVRLRPVVARRRPSPRHGHPRPAQQRHDALRRCLARGEGRCVQALDRIRIPVVDALSRRTEGVIRVMRLRGPGGLVLPVDTGKSAFGLRTCAESAPNVVHMARISGPPGVQVVTQDPRYRHSAVLAIRHGKLGEPGSPAAVVGSKTCR
ncbi:MAG TPA: hypothetical protein VJ418_13220 [Streptosporangiaceae bacterium]|nr:hypothetical protein [Streptosporangiaceae bacterium]